ncbi:helix-turn-helix transcriptional regulator [Pseudomonas sp. WS 5532]|uniref:AraC family transcriptional regulator n=1 Tax=unclassified Pseudomonas TaxID=196821 RepID=UPI000305E1C0|nr:MULTISPECIES: helix-turn-helix transcriptional regulator [unclassified Pseudomonas]MCF5232198.1 helix-turn-helix domain-containing protein [Pseudomonas sp. PA-5-4H]MCF5235681.1 helix-turn-helix domain-containing protein [Pseudomonas sp. PA-5-4G]MCF5248892.1 helix-turn-helix domain-containing protein [Pseudomonas sp. PA-5-4B]MCF5252414.1 helix-turn-helix domain-containing protein [Pseudomonas sp. PA-5-4B]MCF5261769.1 helix-turn-helix domain-containing protein [Pseudomonas sp. PA-5-4A]
MSAPLIPTSVLTAVDDPLVVAVVRVGAEPRITERHCHARGQLLGTRQGLLSVDAGVSQWVVPATHAVWIPPNVAHGARSHGPFAGWSVYVSPQGCVELPDTPCILATSGLLREAVMRAAAWQSPELDAAQQRLAGVIVDEIRTLPRVTLGLPMPQDARLRKIAEALSDCPDDERHLQEWATWAGIAPRTLTRRFALETGFSFTAWRQRVRLLRALERLAAGVPVTRVALELGYDNVSAFIALFRRTFGVTPGRYFTTHESL